VAARRSLSSWNIVTKQVLAYHLYVTVRSLRMNTGTTFLDILPGYAARKITRHHHVVASTAVGSGSSSFRVQRLPLCYRVLLKPGRLLGGGWTVVALRRNPAGLSWLASENQAHQQNRHAPDTWELCGGMWQSLANRTPEQGLSLVCIGLKCY